MDKIKLVKTKSKKRMLFFALVLLCLIIGTSYAVWNYAFIGEDNVISSEEISIDFLEANDIISVTNALPKSDSEGIAQSETFDFAVTTKTTRNMDIGYTLGIEKLTPDEGYTSLSDNDIKVYLTDENDNKLIDPVNPNELENYVLYTDINSHNSTKETIQDKFKIRVWIDTNADFFSWNENTRLQYKFRINVSSIEENNIPRYTVVYDSNTGTGSMSNDQFVVGATNKLKQNVFTKEGYTFEGWSTTANGEVEYQDREIVKNLRTDDQTVTLYAVWKQIINYQVRYNGNGGIVPKTLPITNEENHWTENNGVYKSGNYHIADTISSIRSESFTLTETSTLSFDWAVSCENIEYEYLYYTLYKDGSETALTGTGTSTKISGNYDINDETDLTYTTVTKELEPGSYILEFSYIKDYIGNEGLDRGYVKNIGIIGMDNMPNSNHTNEIASTLSKNIYHKGHYNFIGWSTTLNGEVEYQDENQIKDLTNINNDIVDLYAVWEPLKYKVTVVAQNGIVTSNAEQNIAYNTNGTFTANPNNSTAIGSVTCTNEQIAILTGTTLTVQNVSSDTTCTVTFTTEFTVLYEDGTLIINELTDNRQANIAEHGQITNTYNAMSELDSYIFNDYTLSPWYEEKDSITSVEIGEIIQPTSTAYWFNSLENMSSADFTNLNTSQVENMNSMFYYAGYNATAFNLVGISSWDTSQVTDMGYMFQCAGYNATTWDIDLSNWDTSQVTSMSEMFAYAGNNATTWYIGDLSNWNTSQVKDIRSMFYEAGNNATTFYIGDLSSWNTSQVTNMSSMFYHAGYNATTFDIDLSSWDISKVTNMSNMFNNAGFNATTWNIGYLSNWDTSQVKDMRNMFSYAGENATTFDIGDLSSWNTSKVTDMSGMFAYAGENATTFNSIGRLKISSNCELNRFAYSSSKFKGSLVLKDLPSSYYSDMLYDAATDTSARIDLYYTNSDTQTFAEELVTLYGPSGTSSQGNIYTLYTELSHTVSVIVQDGIVSGNSSQIVVNNQNTSFTLLPNDSTKYSFVSCANGQNGTITNNVLTVLNVTNNTTCTVTFNDKATILHEDGTLIINELLSDKQVNIAEHGQITNTYRPMTASESYIFDYDYDIWGINTSWYNERESIISVKMGESIQPISTAGWFFELENLETGDFTNLDTSQVKDMSWMFYGAGSNATTWDIDLSNLDTSQVKNMSNMFSYAGSGATTWNIDLSNWDTSKVTDMKRMFCYVGGNATTFNLVGLNTWNTSQVTDMSEMFYYNQLLTTLDLSNWNTTRVTDASEMFCGSGITEENLITGSNWTIGFNYCNGIME